MHSIAICHWLQNIQQDATPTVKRERSSSDAGAGADAAMSSPAKRPRPSTPESLPVLGGREQQQQGQQQLQQRTPAGLEATPTQSTYSSLGAGASAGVVPLREVLLPRPAGGKGGAKSPEKPKVTNLPDLARLLAVPVQYTFPPNASGFFPGAAERRLYRRLVRVEHAVEVLPSELRGSIEATVSEDALLPFMWSGAGPPVGDDSDADAGGVTEGQAQPGGDAAELQNIIEIVKLSQMGYRRRMAEGQWNSTIHGRVVMLALGSRYPSVQLCSVTRAQTAEPFRPRLAGSDRDDAVSLASASSAESASTDSDVFQEGGGGSGAKGSFHKIVDLALYLDLEDERARGQELARLVRKFLSIQPLPEQWINSWKFPFLREHPAAVFFETKSAAGKAEDAKVQLGICLAGWHNRMRRIMGQTKRTGNKAHVITVPVILIFEADWEVMFVVDGRCLADPVDEIVSC